MLAVVHFPIFTPKSVNTHRWLQCLVELYSFLLRISELSIRYTRTSETNGFVPSKFPWFILHFFHFFLIAKCKPTLIRLMEMIKQWCKLVDEFWQCLQKIWKSQALTVNFIKSTLITIRKYYCQLIFSLKYCNIIAQNRENETVCDTVILARVRLQKN